MHRVPTKRSPQLYATSSDNIPPYSPYNHHNSDVVYRTVGGADIYGAGTPYPEISK